PKERRRDRPTLYCLGSKPSCRVTTRSTLAGSSKSHVLRLYEQGPNPWLDVIGQTWTVGLNRGGLCIGSVGSANVSKEVTAISSQQHLVLSTGALHTECSYSIYKIPHREHRWRRRFTFVMGK